MSSTLIAKRRFISGESPKTPKRDHLPLFRLHFAALGGDFFGFFGA
jgi:hypothetical protein